MTERRYLLLVVGVFALALALRLLPLAWSPYPATLDGIGYAAQARDALAVGHLPLRTMRADNLVFATFLATAGVIFDITPLKVAQPVVAFVGAASVVAPMAIVRRFGRDLDFSTSKVRLATVLVGLGLAVDGLYLRRTGVPDEEALAFLVLPLLVLALHRGLRTDRRVWLAIAGVFLVALPLTHTFSTLVAGTTLLAWVAAARRPLSLTRLVAGITLVAGFWGYFAGYYTITARLGFVVPYVGRVTAHPGLFVAWLVAMVIGIWWFQGTSRHGKVAIVLAPVLVGIGVVLVNTVQPVFPGTVTSPGVLPYLLVVFLVPAVLAAAAAPRLASNREGSIVLLALLAAPVILVGFSLTADLTPEFFGTVMRTQTFAHLPFLGLAAIGVAGVTDTRDRMFSGWRHPGFATVLLAALILTAPIAYVDLDTLAFPSTTTESEFQAATFAAERVEGAWTSDHVLTRIDAHYFDGRSSIGPTAAWLGGGPTPNCALLSATSWSTAGAHLFPAGPRTVTPDEFQQLLDGRQLIYSSGEGYDSFAVSLSLDPKPDC